MNPLQMGPMQQLHAVGTGLDQVAGAIGQGIHNFGYGLDNMVGIQHPQQPTPTPQPTTTPSPTPQPAQPQGFNFNMQGIQNFLGGLQGQHLLSPMAQQPANAPVMQQPSPTPTMMPGQQEWMKNNAQYMQGMSPEQMGTLYRTAVTAPGGHYYQPSPTPQQAVLGADTEAPAQPGVSQVKDLPQAIPGVKQEVSQAFTNILNNQILPVTRQYGIPDAVVAAQAAQESGYGTSPAATQQNNYFGLMHFDPQSGQRSIHSFQSPQEAAKFYAQTVSSLAGDMTGKSPLEVMQALQGGKSRYEGDNQNPMQYVYDVSHNPAWQAYGGGTPYATNPWGK